MIETSTTIRALEAACQRMPRIWNGRKAILEMKEGGSRHWRQMEWMGFYFEFLCQKEFRGILQMPGNKYGNTEFDAFGEMSWDLKAHASNAQNHTVILNDTEAIEKTMDDYGNYGLVLAIGEVEYNDVDGSFKAWHDRLKGDVSNYEKNRIKRKAKSRLRKTEFVLSEIRLISLSEATLNACSGTFQKGFRNADGSPRRQKTTINIAKLPDLALINSLDF